MKVFKTVFAICLLMFSQLPALAQTGTQTSGTTTVKPPFEQWATFNTANTSSTCWIVPVGVAYYTMRWENPIGTVSSGTVKLIGSMSSTCASPTDIIAAQTVTGGGQVVGTADPKYRYIRLVPASVAGGGTVRVYVAAEKSAASVGSAVTVTSGNITVSDGAGALNVICDSGCSGGTQYTEDAAAAADPIGNALILVRKDTPAATVSADGDNIAWRGGNFGNGYVTIIDSTGAFVPSSTGGSGTIDANTQRIVIATDDPLEANIVAHDAADTGNPLKIGAKATTSISALTMVANNDRTNLFAGIDGVLITRPYANLEDRVTATPVGITDGTSTSVVGAQGSGIRFCATDITVANSSATNVTVDLRDGTAGAVIWTFPAAATYGGATHPFNTPICTTANTALAADPSAAASTVTISVNGFKTKL